jgi:thiamine-phosphate diphosphorylase
MPDALNPDTPLTLEGALRLLYVADVPAVQDWRRLDHLFEGGVTGVWLRAPGATGAELHRAARDLVRRASPFGVAVIVGDRADVAMAVGAHGVQLGHRSPPAQDVRPWFPGWVGVSCHSAGELARAAAANADYCVLSPVFGVPRKGAPLGTLEFAALRSGVELPVVALGGVELTNVASLLEAGADGLAAIRCLRDSPDPEGTARALRTAVDANRSEPAAG